MSRFAPLAIAVALLSGCPLSHARLMDNLRTRASFDMNCPNAELQLTELTESGGGNVNSVGVRGCGQQAVYVRANDHTNWVLDSKQATPPPGE